MFYEGNPHNKKSIHARYAEIYATKSICLKNVLCKETVRNDNGPDEFKFV